MDAVRIRAANMADREALCRLYQEFHEFHVRGVPDRLLSLGAPPGSHEGSELYLALESIIRAGDSAILVAEVNHQLVGLVEAYIRQDEPHSLRVSYRYGHLQSLMVLAAFRRHGIGRRLLEAAQAWAQARGAAEIRLETWEFAGGPEKFYEHLGYRTLRRTWVRNL